MQVSTKDRHTDVYPFNHQGNLGILRYVEGKHRDVSAHRLPTESENHHAGVCIRKDTQQVALELLSNNSWHQNMFYHVVVR